LGVATYRRCIDLNGITMSIDESKFVGIDLNLLLVFMVVFREGSLSKAAECLNVGQPAVSGSLSRLRSRFDDRLFLSVGRKGVRPTHKAIEMAEMLLPALSALQKVVDGAVR
jgi:DNA-binding transcriptional LysR family regulator